MLLSSFSLLHPTYSLPFDMTRMNARQLPPRLILTKFDSSKTEVKSNYVLFHPVFDKICKIFKRKKIIERKMDNIDVKCKDESGNDFSDQRFA